LWVVAGWAGVEEVGAMAVEERDRTRVATIARDRVHGWIIVFSRDNDWGMPVEPLPLPYTSRAGFDYVAARLRERFDRIIVAVDDGSF
jgi:hypothetical protein